MTVKLLGTVRGCSECPHRSYYSGGVYECAKVEQKLAEGVTMPVWCPLPDHPAAHIAPAQSAVANVRAILLGLQRDVTENTSISRIQQVIEIAIQQLPPA